MADALRGIRAPRLAISASAGSGKTFQLAHRYVSLLARGAAPERILAVTFTRKAAAEILRRIVELLAGAALDARTNATLAERIGCDLPRGKALALLEDLVRRIHRLEIGTLDSFFSRLARRLHLDVCLPPGWRIVEEDVERELRAEAVRRLLGRWSRRDAVEILRLLSAGEVGRSVHAQIVELAEEMLEVFFESEAEAWRWPPAAAGRGALDDAARDAAIAALGAVALPQHQGFCAGWEKVRALAAAGDWKQLLENGLVPKVLLGERTYYKKELDPAGIDLILRLARHGLAKRLDDLRTQNAATRSLLERYSEVHGDLKARWRAASFADVTRVLAMKLHGASLEELLARLEVGVEHVLLDEFQDTSLAQWKVLRPLVESVVREGRAGRSFFCVGDPKQSIYGWRGGEAAILDEVRALPGVERESLATSHRSAPAIIEVVNHVFGGLLDNPLITERADELREPTGDWLREFVPHETVRRELEGSVRLTVAPVADADGDVLAHAADVIAAAHRAAPERSIGVLVRRNKAVSRLIHELRLRDVAASEEGGARLTDSPAVCALLSAIELADHPGDTVARFHVAASPLAAVVGLEEPADDAAVRRFGARVRRGLVERGYGRWIGRWVDRTAEICDEGSRRRLEQLADAAYRYDAAATLRPADFVRFVRSLKVEDASASPVRVMTVHQAKGLEFDHVFLPELDVELNGQQPRFLTLRPRPTSPPECVTRYFSEKLLAAAPELEPFHSQHRARRIRDSLSWLYVAMTRAAHALDMIIARKPKKEASFSTLLRQALAPGRDPTPGAVLYEKGAAPAAAAPREPAAARVAEPVRPGAAEIAWLPPPAGRRGLHREAPSALARRPDERLGDVLRLERGASLRRGSILHRWIELIEWIEDGEPADAELRASARAERLEDGEFEALAAELRGALARPLIRRALSRTEWQRRAKELDARLVLERELPFAVRSAERLIAGSIDRLVALESRGRIVEACVIDFKTDRIEPGDDARLDELVELYRPQIAEYREAVARLFELQSPAVSTSLVFLAAGAAREV